jgi:hypothetical protein
MGDDAEAVNICSTTSCCIPPKHTLPTSIASPEKRRAQAAFPGVAE